MARKTDNETPETETTHIPVEPAPAPGTIAPVVAIPNGYQFNQEQIIRFNAKIAAGVPRFTAAEEVDTGL